MNLNYDEKLLNISIEVKNGEYFHFQNHPSFLPFIGDLFDDSKPGCRILFVGESHYISNETSVAKVYSRRFQVLSEILESNQKKIDVNSKFADIWYSKMWNNNKLKSVLEENGGASYYQTRNIVDSFTHNDYKGRAITMMFGYPLKSYSENFTEKGMSMSLVNHSDFNNFLFLNYFQRPSLDTGDSIVNVELDNNISAKILNEAIEILKIDHVFILSKKGYDSYINHKNCKYADKVTRLVHPCSRVWSKSDTVDGLNGKSSAQYLHDFFMAHCK